MADIGAYGVGVQLYFNFICALCFVFFMMGCLVIPALEANGKGMMMKDDAPGLAKVGEKLKLNFSNYQDHRILTI